MHSLPASTSQVGLISSYALFYIDTEILGFYHSETVYIVSVNHSTYLKVQKLFSNTHTHIHCLIFPGMHLICIGCRSRLISFSIISRLVCN